jgi:hypothetical protein
MVVLVFVCVCAVAPRQCTSQFEIVVHVVMYASQAGYVGRRGGPDNWDRNVCWNGP